jgi:ubiquinone/menaquinone biosynthesis C-methylase UbiE
MKFSKFFSNIQEAPWYRQFLNSVIDEIGTNGKLLDIGTGSGKLIQILANEKGINCIGVDTNEKMLDEAKIKLKETNVSLIKIEANRKFPFEKNSFRYVTICNVLFHLEKEGVDFVLTDTQRILEKGGKIIILTPTGNGNIFTLSKNYFSLENLSIYIWFRATKNRARTWTKNKYLEQYAHRNKLQYESQIVMDGFAQLEIIKE